MSNGRGRTDDDRAGALEPPDPDAAPSGKPPLGERLRAAFLKPEPDAKPSAARPAGELEAENKSATDKERMVGLLLAPWAAGIAILVAHELISHDPVAKLATGLANPKHVAVSYYWGVAVVLLALAVCMLAAAWFRKRALLAIVMAAYGLSLFNLHYWGFAIPYLLCAGWLLARAYRLQRELREATGSTGGRTPAASRDPGAPTTRPGATKRYTPKGSKTRP
jgi:hypothetical protein